MVLIGLVLLIKYLWKGSAKRGDIIITGLDFPIFSGLKIPS